MAGLTGLNLIITRCNMLLYNQKLQAVARATTIFMPKPPCIPEISSIPMYPALSQSIDFWVIKQVKVFAQLLLLFFSFQPAIEPLVLIWIGGSMVWCKFNRTLLHSSRVGAFPRCLCAAIDPTCKKCSECSEGNATCFHTGSSSKIFKRDRFEMFREFWPKLRRPAKGRHNRSMLEQNISASFALLTDLAYQLAWHHVHFHFFHVRRSSEDAFESCKSCSPKSFLAQFNQRIIKCTC